MLRRFADSVLESLLEAFPSSENYSRDAFEAAPMPGAIARYLTQSLQTRVEVEMTPIRSFGSVWLDVDHSEVRAAAAALASRLAEHARIPAEEWQTTLERAVRNAISYHARPARTLLDFLFVRTDDTYTLSGLERKLSFFLPYPHLTEHLNRHVEEYGTEDLDRSALAGILGKIDRELAERYDVGAWMQLFQPMFEIASVLETFDNDVPVALAVAFFRDKGVERVEVALERLHEVQGVEALSPERLKAVLAEARMDQERAYVVSPEVVDARPSADPSRATQSTSAEPGRMPTHRPTEEPRPSPRKPAASIGDQDARSQRSTAEVDKPPGISSPADPVPLWKQFQHGQSRPAPSPPPIPRPNESEPSRPRTAPPQSSVGERKPLWMRYAHVAPRTSATVRGEPAGLADDLDRLEETVLGEASRDRALFLRYLFGGSKADYSTVLLKLSKASDWTEASRIIGNDVFQRNQVDIYSDAAVAFTDAVESRFEEA